MEKSFGSEIIILKKAKGDKKWEKVIHTNIK